MRLKKIEIVGFKSFADREVIHVDDSITAIIGPNGCGKSNVVDAIRWCMGEQSAKHLRGSGMADVIFAGCATRGAAGMAEVTLTLETEGELPAYAAFPEIGLTRRLFGDGTSEYLINKVPSRLRDITDVLMGTGAGTRGYSIIEQGQVGQIVTSKPEQRRHIIDEAAGITKFKAQKAAADRKILATRQNLMRVRDVIGELEARLGTLRRQAQKAERYRRYRDEQRELELWSGTHRFLELRSTRSVLAARQADLRGQVDDLRAALATQETHVEAARLRYAEVESELSGKQKAVYELDNRLQLLQADDEHRKRERERLTQSVAHARTEIEVLERELGGLEEELAQVDAKRAELGGSDSPHHTEVSDRQAEFDAAQERLHAATAKADALAQEVSRLSATAAGAQARLDSRREQAEELSGRLQKLRDSGHAMRDQVAEEEAAVHRCAEERDAANTRVDALREQQQAADVERGQLREQQRASEVELDTVRGELQRTKSRLQSLEEIEARYQGCQSGVQVIMEHRQNLRAQVHTDGSVDTVTEDSPAVFGIMADHVRAPEHLEPAVSAILGDRLQGVVVQRPDTGLAGVGLLKELREGRTHFLPRECRTSDGTGAASAGWQPPNRAGGAIEVVDLSSSEPAVADGTASVELGEGNGAAVEGTLGRLADLVEVSPDVRDLAERLFGRAYVVEDLPRALELWAKHPGCTWVTPEGDRVEASGVVVGGSADALDSALLQQKREIRELTAMAAELQERYDEVRRRHQAVGEALALVEERRETLATELLKAEKECSTAQALFGQRERAADQARQRLAAFDGDLQGLESQAESLTGEITADEEALAAATARAPEAEREHGAAREAADAAREELDTRREALTEAKIRLARWQQEIDALQDTRSRLNKQIGSERNRIERLQQSVTDSDARLAELVTAGSDAERERVEVLEQSKGATEQVHDARERFDALRLELEELEVSIRNLRRDADAHRERLQEVEVGLRELELEREHLVTDVETRFDVSLEEALVDFHDRKVAGRVERERAAELKRILGRMGEVNLTAIHEFEEVNDRYEYLTRQRDDLESAIAQLEEAIDQINRTTRQRFRETFDLVNERFQTVFPRLFAGGRAELKLTDPQDLLATGVEIAAQPPGKQLRSLELLSGGEKALTAVSLIFAIFLIKPSPFCLLDEVDAPLDDANVGRFCGLIRELSAQTQFIVITHNKVSMEIADRLYGVTMQQRGVSKLVSVNMRRAVELAN